MAQKLPTSIREHVGIRESAYPMISISSALQMVLNEIKSPTEISHVRLSECGNRVLAQDIYAPIDLPRCNTSIMDGYAMNYALNDDNQSMYSVVDIVTAGNEDKQTVLQKGEVLYVTTGSALPPGTDCVVKVEDTEIINESTIKMLCPPKGPLQSVRTKGSDIAKGQLLLRKGDRLRSSEMGILASCGIVAVAVYSKVRVTVLSTGDEVADPFTFNGEEKMNLIFDSNKVMLMQSMEESLRNLCAVTDGGIVGDDRKALKQHILELLRETDVLVATGGVFIGSRYYMKSILSEIGQIKFGRIGVKPGNHSTFATVMVPESGDDPESTRKALIFGLPGNPVAAQIGYKMLVEPAIRKWTGISDDLNTLHPPISVEITKDIRMDSRFERYHRCVAYWDKGKSRFIGHDTGPQRGSRLLSSKSANCFLRIPQKEGVLKRGSMVKALVIGPLTPRMPPKVDVDNDDGNVLQQNLMECDCGKSESVIDIVHDLNRQQHSGKRHNMGIRIGVLTVSDRVASGVYVDRSGPVLTKGLKAIFGMDSSDGIESKVVANEKEEIEECLTEWDGRCHLIVTTGGTGSGPRDVTPESTNKFIERECSGIVFKMMQFGLQQTDFACLSRYNAGISHKHTLIINMPGKVKAVRECLLAIQGILTHSVFQIGKSTSDSE